MSTNPKIGVFICKCGEKIEPLVDLATLQKNVCQDPDVAACDILPYPCLEPGMNQILGKIRDEGLNRIIVAGCESRLMLKKFETHLEPEGLRKGQVDVVNLRGHVAGVSDASPDQKAVKGAKLIRASVAEMVVLHPSIQKNVTINHPPIIVGGGIASFSAAQELGRQGIDCLLSLPEHDPEAIITHIHEKYPGERNNYGRLRTTIMDVLNNDRITILPPGELSGLSGITGGYTASFTIPDKMTWRQYQAGTVIACLDSELSPPAQSLVMMAKPCCARPNLNIWCGAKKSPKAKPFSGSAIMSPDNRKTHNSPPGQPGPWAGISLRTSRTPAWLLCTTSR
jgi:heterodisulfide reductase subunit A